MVDFSPQVARSPEAGGLVLVHQLSDVGVAPLAILVFPSHPKMAPSVLGVNPHLGQGEGE